MNGCRTNRAIGRPRKRWEDDINQVEEETENLTESSNHISKNLDQHSKRPRKMDSTPEENYTMTSEGRHENNTRMRRNSHNIPARYVNGVKLSVEEVAQHHITLMKRSSKVKKNRVKMEMSFGKPQHLRHQLRMHYPNEALVISSRSAVKNIMKDGVSSTT